MEERISKLVEKYSDVVVAYRRDIHENPELGYEEMRTAGKIAQILMDLGLEVKTNVGKTGVVGILKGKKSGKTIALRADMDALPLQEKTGLPYSSKNDRVMHACGHDTHTAMLLGTAHVLTEFKNEIEGTIKFIFQPAEECNPHGGAKGMIEEGVLENPKVDGILGLHVWPNLVNNTIGIREGAMMSASDRIFITIKGKSAHGSAPEQGIDAGLIASYVMTALQSIVSRNISPMDACVVTIGKINGGYRYNVIPDNVILEGTVRTIDPATREKIPQRIEQIIKGVVEGMGGGYEFEYVHGYPVTMNDQALAKKVRESIIRAIGKENLVDIPKPALGGEDFSFYTEKVPSTFMWLGCRPAHISVEDFAPVHNPMFNPSEETFTTGVKVMAMAAIDLLNSQS